MDDPISARYGHRYTSAQDVTDASRLLLSHLSCRAYLDKPVPEGVLEVLIAAAQSAPSSCNLHCWSVVAVSDPVQKEALAQISGNQAHPREAPVLLCFLADLSAVEALAETQDLAPVALDYLEMTLMGVIDATLAAQNLATAAQSYGLGTCYIGGMRNNLGRVAELLELPERVLPVFGMTLGYPDLARASEIRPRPLPQSVLHRDRYSPPDRTGLAAEYDAAMAEFNERQGRKAPAWSQASAERIASIARMEGRDGLLPWLRSRGLALK